MNKILVMYHDGTNSIFSADSEKQFNSIVKVVKFLFDSGQVMGWSLDPLDM